MRKAFLITICSIVLAACSNSSTNSGLEQGTNTESFAGNYEGILELELIADTINYDPQFSTGSGPIEVEITGHGIVYLTIDNYTLEGIIDNEGEWKLEVAINEFRYLIDSENIDILKRAGCPLDKPFIEIEGTVTPPDMLGDVSGELSCRILLVKIATVEFSGALTVST